MHILVATTGVLPPARTVEICHPLLRDGGKLTIMTVIEVPRAFLAAMDEDERRSFLADVDWESAPAERKALEYLEERGRRVVDPVVAAFRAYRHEPSVLFVEGTDPADAIIGAATEVGADVIVMGSTRRLFTEEAWTSVSARVMERTHCPLVVVPGTRARGGPRRLSRRKVSHPRRTVGAWTSCTWPPTGLPPSPRAVPTRASPSATSPRPYCPQDSLGHVVRGG